MPRQQIGYKQIGECVCPVERKHRCLLVNAQNFAVRHWGCRPHAQELSSQRAFSEKLSLARWCSTAAGCVDGEAHFPYETYCTLVSPANGSVMNFLISGL
jgi:hypothetical protein